SIAKLKPADIDHVALARPLPPGSALASALRAFTKAKVDTVDHHAAHAAAAFYASPFEEARVITLDLEGGREHSHPRRGNSLSEFDRRTLWARYRTPRHARSLGRTSGAVAFNDR